MIGYLPKKVGKVVIYLFSHEALQLGLLPCEVWILRGASDRNATSPANSTVQERPKTNIFRMNKDALYNFFFFFLLKKFDVKLYKKSISPANPVFKLLEWLDFHFWTSCVLFKSGMYKWLSDQITENFEEFSLRIRYIRI